MNLIALGFAVTAATAPSPEMRGAVDSPVAFYEACRDASAPPADVLKKASPAERASLDIAVELCKGMIQGVASTVANADGGYSFDGNKVCVSPTLTSDQVLAELGEMVTANRDRMVADQELKTPGAILIALQRLSSCK